MNTLRFKALLHSPRLGLLAFSWLPIFLCGIFSIWFIVDIINARLAWQNQQFARSLTDHLAQAVTHHLINHDVLSLNVLLSDAVANDYFTTASIYNARNELIVQTGHNRHQGDSGSIITLNQQVTYQNTIAGLVQVSFKAHNTILPLVIMTCLFHGLLLVLVGLAIWFFADAIYFGVPLSKPQDTTTHRTVTNHAEPSDATTLVLKVKPERLLQQYGAILKKIASLYCANQLKVDHENIIMVFNQQDQVFKAICAGLLALEVIRKINPKVGLQAGLHKSPTNENELAKARKYASYLAAMSDNQLLAHKGLSEPATDNKRYHTEAFYNSLIPDGEVITISHLTNHHLIICQSLQLLKT